MNPVMSTEKLTPKHDSGPIELVFETDTPRKTTENSREPHPLNMLVKV